MEIVEGGVSVALTTIQSSTGELISLAEAFAWPGAAGEEADMADLPTPQDAYRFITNLDEVDLARFRVIGPDACCHEGTRNALQDARQKILPGLMSTGHKRKKHLMWAAPDGGKSNFVQHIAASLVRGIRYEELNLAECTESQVRSGLTSVNSTIGSLCLMDEVDAKPQESWPYELLLPHLDGALDRGASFVFAPADSSSAGIDELKQRIGARPKRTGLLSRFPP